MELGPYRLVRELGSGGMGRVYLAERGDDRFALKVLHPHLLGSPGAFRRFVQEAQIGQRIEHDNVVRTLDVDSDEVDGQTYHFLVTEFVEGRTLRDLLGELGRVPEELCRHIAREVAKGLAAIHADGVVHRDLKPENILITDDHVVKVMDLGIARLTEASIRLSMTGAFVGSIRYAAPEQFEFDEIDAGADWYALGITLYELVTGEHPDGDGDALEVIRRRLEHPPRPAGELNPQVSPYFEEVLRALLARNRERRLDHFPEEDSDWWRDRARSLRAETQAPLRRARVPRETPLVGRETELARLRERFVRVAAGDGEVVLVEGEAGIGKSRLLDEFIAGLGAEAHRLGGFDSAHLADGAFVAALREQFGETGVERYLEAAPALAAPLNALLRGESPPDGLELDRHALESALVHLLRALAAERPTVVWLDDLDEATPREVAMFTALARALRGHRILLVGSGRRIGLPAPPGIVTRLLVDRLDDESIARMVEPLLEARGIAAGAAAGIAARSDGNPFFAVEIALGLPAGEPAAPILTPASVQDLIEARLAGLEKDERRLLDVASCAGVEFDPVLAGEAIGLDAITSLQLLAAVERRLRLVRSAGRDYRFDHRLLRDALYAALSEPLREAYHGALAERLERNHPVEADRAVAVVGHYLAAGRIEAARPYLDPTWRHLERGLRWAEALALGERALPLLGDDDRFELLLRTARWHDGAVDRAAQGAAAGRALEAAGGDPAREARARRVRGTWLWRTSKLDDARADLERALELARAQGLRTVEADVLGALGRVLLSSGRLPEALALFVERRALVQESGDRTEQAQVENDLGNANHALGRWDAAQAHYERAAAIAHEIGEVRLAAAAEANVALAHKGQGRYEEARAIIERNIAMMRKLGDRIGLAKGIMNLGNLRLMRAEYTEAVPELRRGLELARELGDRESESAALSNLGLALMWLGRIGEARETFEECLAITREIGNAEYEAGDLRSLGQSNLFLGRIPEARAALEEALRIAREIDAAAQIVYALADLGEIAHAEGDHDRGRALHQEQEERAAEAGDRLHAAIAQAALGVEAERRGDLDLARTKLEQARATAVELGLTEVRLISEAWLAGLPGGDVQEALRIWEECGDKADFVFRLEVLDRLFRVTGDRSFLDEAYRVLQSVRDHAPEQDRDSMLRQLPLYRRIVEAHG